MGMTQILWQGTLGAISRQEDLNPKGFGINGPPRDGRCDVKRTNPVENSRDERRDELCH